MKSTVSEKGQVTIPKPLRDRLGLRPGDSLEFEEVEGRLIGRKTVEHDRIAAVRGTLKLDVSVDEFIDELRGPGPE